MFAANRSIVLSPREKFARTDGHIQYFMENIFITDTLDTIKSDILKEYDVGTIVTISSVWKYMDIKNDNLEIVKYNKDNPCREYFKICSIHIPLNTVYSSYYIADKLINIELLAGDYVSSIKKILIVCPSFDMMLPIFIEYFKLFINNKQINKNNNNFRKQFNNKDYISSMLRPFCTRGNLDQYSTFIADIKSNQT